MKTLNVDTRRGLSSGLWTIWLFLCVSPVMNWDISVSTSDRLEFFYKNGTDVFKTDFFLRTFGGTYDPVYQILFFSNEENGNYTVLSFHPSEDRGIHYSRRITTNTPINNMVYDPVSRKLFWTDEISKIYYMFIVPESESESNGSVFIEMFENERPMGIALDLCRSYLYWANINVNGSCIERAKTDGSNRKTIIQGNLDYPGGITIDQSSEKIYWVDDMHGIHFKIECADLDGSNRKTIHFGKYEKPRYIAVNKNVIYYADTEQHTLRKYVIGDDDSTLVRTFSRLPSCMIFKVNISEEIEGKKECTALQQLISSNKTLVYNDSLNSSYSEYCLNGGKLRQTSVEILTGKKQCICPDGYSGYRCEIYICHNYCVHGGCTLDKDRLPVCRCDKGFIGTRCQEAYCLNQGVYKPNKNRCDCQPNFIGQRCEFKEIEPALKPNIRNYSSNKTLNGTNSGLNNSKNKLAIAEFYKYDLESDSKNATNQIEDVTLNSLLYPQNFTNTEQIISVENNCADWAKKTILTGVISFSSIIFVLAFIIMILIYKIMMLRKRPRIIKRIVARKNVTPLTYTPNQNQSEITVENCCNMNICETPCFEPENLHEHLLDMKAKEEKKNLLSNIEHQGYNY